MKDRHRRRLCIAPNDVIRIHDIFFQSDALYDTDLFFANNSVPIHFPPVSSAEIHYILGEYLLQRRPESHN
jgi:hypothetical protein